VPRNLGLAALPLARPRAIRRVDRRRDAGAKSTAAYACGHPGMIEDLARPLTPRGFLAKEEKYWKE